MVSLVPLNMFKPSRDVLLAVPRRSFFCGSFLSFMFHLCYVVLSVPCGLAITCWECADLLALLCVVFSCVFVTLPYGVLGEIVSIPDLCLLSTLLC